MKINNFFKNIKSFIINNKHFIIFILISILIGTTLNLMTIKSIGNIKSIISNLLIALLYGSFSYIIKQKYYANK